MFSQRRSHYWSQQSRTFFFKGFSAKQQKKPKKAANYSVIEQNALSDKHPKMTGQNDRPDESLTGQAHDQAGHCPLTGLYFEPWPWVIRHCILQLTSRVMKKWRLKIFHIFINLLNLKNFSVLRSILKEGHRSCCLLSGKWKNDLLWTTCS